METRSERIGTPFFSICIPQYNRTPFLIEACRTLVNQTFRNFEVCISDDCSTDGKEKELLEFLEHSEVSFVYRQQQQNLKYDANLRASIALSAGQYCFLLGNDDALSAATTLQELYDEIEKYAAVGVVITNFEDFVTGKEVRRIRKTGLLGAGPVVAANNYRNVSFVSGVVLDGNRARALATSQWDGSEMYQMFLACRIIAEGGQLLGVERVAVRKDLQIAGQQVDSYAKKPRLHPCPIIERRHTFHLIGRLVMDAIGPYLASTETQPVSEKVVCQLLVFTYPYWIFEFRRVQSWNYAAGICLGMRPANLTRGLGLGLLRRWRVATVYSLVSLLGLAIPIGMFDRLYRRLHALAKSRFAVLIAGARRA